MITIKTLKIDEMHVLSDKDEELINALCFRLGSLETYECNDREMN